MQFGFPRDRQLHFSDFNRLRPAQRRGRAAMFMKLATLYAKYVGTFRPNFRKLIVLSAVVLGAGTALQAAHLVPDWVPVWLFGILAWNRAAVRAPNLHPNVLAFLKEAGTTTASGMPADMLQDRSTLLMLIWVSTGYMTNEWLSLNAGMTGFVVMTLTLSVFRLNRMISGNLEALHLAGERVMEIAEDAKAELKETELKEAELEEAGARTAAEED